MADSQSPTGKSAPQPTAPSQPLPGATPLAGGVPRLDSRAIFSGAQEVEIEHRGAVYRLRQTSLGKLILTK